jgi:MFS family permease
VQSEAPQKFVERIVKSIDQVVLALRRHFRLPSGDLLRDAVYRRLWTSILISSFGGQVTMLALPLTAAVLLQATPTQMGLLGAMEIAPFVLFSLPAGVWLDRVRKLPVYVAGETLLAAIVASIPLAWTMGWLSMTWLYVADGKNERIYVLLRDTLEVLTTFGDGGRQPGQFFAVHSIVTDSAGNLFTTETYEGRRLQKFAYKGIDRVPREQGVVWPRR